MSNTISKCINALFASALLALAASPVIAAVPNEAEVRQLQRMLGYDRMGEIAVDRLVASNPWLEAQSPEARGCVAGQVRQVMDIRLLAALFTTFQSSDNVQAWLHFGSSGSGAKLMQIIRDNMAALAEGQPKPDHSEQMKQFSETEMREIGAFFSSPVGKLVSAGNIPDISGPLTDSEMAALMQGLHSVCHFEPKRI